MSVTPRDMLNYVLEKQKEHAFLTALSLHKGNYSIGEITDRELIIENEKLYLKSPSFHLNLPVEDEEIFTAVHNGLYVSPFLSRLGDSYQIHFLVHHCPVSMKPQFEEEITKEVVHYMILKTIMALRLDTGAKIDSYCKF